MLFGTQILLTLVFSTIQEQAFHSVYPAPPGTMRPNRREAKHAAKDGTQNIYKSRAKGVKYAHATIYRTEL